MKKCRIPGCGRPAHGKGLCAAHYRRQRRGQPMRTPIKAQTHGSVEDRLKAYVEIDPETGCHLWTGHCDPNGYGRMGVSKRYLSVHRVAWQLTNGPIPEGKIVLHDCDNRRCCNPEHLSLGTHAENARDRVARKRTKGCRERDLERHPQWADPYGAPRREDSTDRPGVLRLRSAAARSDRAREGPR